MNRIEKIAARMTTPKADMDLDEMTIDVAKFINENPEPDDEKFHKWAEKQGYDVHKAEAAAYKLATLFTNFFFHGRAADKGISRKDVDKKQLEMGIKIEYEHTDEKLIAERIALDHLAELDDYYDRLVKMEKEAKNE